MSVSVARIGHIGITVADLDRTVEFYCRFLGLRLTERFDYGESELGHGTDVIAGAFVRCDSTHHCISFFVRRDSGDAWARGGGAQPSTRGSGLGLHHLAFEMRTPEDLLAKYREFRGAGIPIVNARAGGPGNQPRFYATDPDGNLLEFYWGIDSIGWDGRPREYGPIEEIELEDFNFEAFEQQRDVAAAQAR